MKNSEFDLKGYDLIMINTSGGKDSICTIWSVITMAKYQKFPFERIVFSHQNLGRCEWPGTKQIVVQQRSHFDLMAGTTFDLRFSKRVTKEKKVEDLLEHIERRRMWPDSKNRYCTSDHKRGPGDKVVRKVSEEYSARNILNVFGFRAEESPARKKLPVLKLNERLSTVKRKVYDYLPIHHWTLGMVWQTIEAYKIPYHYAYDLGMPRLSCVFCIFSPENALHLAGIHNEKLLNEYVQVEKNIQHTFRKGFKIESILEKIKNQAEIGTVEDWKM